MRKENEALNEQNPGFLEGRGCLLVGWCVYKHNPLNCAIASKARVWRKKSESLMITGKGSKELAGGKRLHVIVAIAYGKGVVLKVPYGKMRGKSFKKFVRQHFQYLLCKVWA